MMIAVYISRSYLSSDPPVALMLFCRRGRNEQSLEWNSPFTFANHLFQFSSAKTLTLSFYSRLVSRPISLLCSVVIYRPSSQVPPDMDRDAVRTRFRAQNFRINFDRELVRTIFRWTLIVFNAILILAILVGVFVFFSEYREKYMKGTELASDSSSEASGSPSPGGQSSGPKYAWIVMMMAFAMMLAIPCLGFVGAIKENACLLILYGVIFIVQAIVVLIFRSFWFLFMALIASAAMGLVILMRPEKEDAKQSIPIRNRFNWCLDKV
jgi:hypothetical protein